jgi:hypothetical protein
VCPGHGIEVCGITLAFFVVFSEVAEGVQISHVSDPTTDGAAGCSCAMLNSSGRDDSGRLRQFRLLMACLFGGEDIEHEDRGKMFLSGWCVDARCTAAQSMQSGHTLGCIQHIHWYLRIPREWSVQSKQLRCNRFSAGFSLIIVRIL